MTSLKKSDKSVAVIGGGVAGMAATEVLHRHGIETHLIEKKDCLGGHAALWACMATQSCQNCGGCLSVEAADKLSRLPNLHVRLNSQATGISQQNGKYEICLNGEDSPVIKTDKILFTTGFTPATPQGLLKKQLPKNDAIITTADLNRILSSNSMDRYIPNNGSIKIGFVQCVGSRNKTAGTDYCSQVCCKVSLRHIKKLLFLYPNAQIFLFYIDLQVIGKQARWDFNAMSNNVTLIQGVPFEFYSHDYGNLVVVSEDPATGCRREDLFDLMVLSVGMRASDHLPRFSGIPALDLNPWGFIQNQEIATEKGIYSAGCATGPMDILTARAQGIQCAGQIIRDLSENNKKSADQELPVAVIGDGNQAKKTIAAVLATGRQVFKFSLDSQNDVKTRDIQTIHDAKIVSVTGTIGQFVLHYRKAGKNKQMKCAAIILAPSSRKHTEAGRLQISDKHLLSLSGFLDCVSNEPETIPDTLTFWPDYSGHAHKVDSRKALHAAINLARDGKQIYFITTNMLVHTMEGQRLYDAARKTGITFLRVDSSESVKVNQENGKLKIDLKERTLGNIEVSFESHWLIIPETRIPCEHNSAIADLLKETLDHEGYLQSPNVRHRPVASPRRGIFYTGACHDEVDQQDRDRELELILAALDESAHTGSDTCSADITVNRNKCKQCLTCFRICPHGAVVLKEGKHPEIVTKACFSCGLCMSSCPAKAIESEKYPDTSFTPKESSRKITVFACERSAALAAKQLMHNHDIGVQPVPCVCRINENVILKTLEKGVEKVILAGCHQGNCRSVKGSSHAELRIRQLQSLPGIDPARIHHFSIAANEPGTLTALITGINQPNRHSKGYDHAAS